MRPTSPPHALFAKLSFALVSGALFFFAARPASADVPPPPDSPDAHCTPEEQCPHGVYCPYSNHPGKAPDPDEVPVGKECRASATAKGLEHRCSNGGNYGGQDLYCPKGETGSWSPPGAARSCSRCALGTGAPATPEGLWIAFGLAATAMLRRRPATKRR